jgi:transglutaminase-like putative cysteine protease
MKYKITHTTRYQYADAVPVCHNKVHLAPRKTATQECDQHRLLVHPTPADRRKRFDYFGNQVDYFAIHAAHRELTVTAISRIEVAPPPPRDPAATPAWERLATELNTDRGLLSLEAYQFVLDSQRVNRSSTLAVYAKKSFLPGRPVLEAARDLTARVHADFVYDPRATTVHSALEDVFRHRRGVCQDFAHVQIGCLRSLGLAARYVSGYLRTVPPPGRPRLAGADASHAWVSIYCGEAGWVDLDPTNNMIPTTDHITIAWGRDYSDVCPIQGVYVGGGQQSMTVSVDVAPLE